MRENYEMELSPHYIDKKIEYDYNLSNCAIAKISVLTKEQIKSIKISTGQNDRLPVIFGVLGDLGRFRIFKILIEHREICVTDVAAILDITVSAASQQLRVLERVGLVRKERMRQMVCYEVRDDDPFVKLLLKILS